MAFRDNGLVGCGPSHCSTDADVSEELAAICWRWKQHKHCFLSTKLHGITEHCVNTRNSRLLDASTIFHNLLKWGGKESKYSVCPRSMLHGCEAVKNVCARLWQLWHRLVWVVTDVFEERAVSVILARKAACSSVTFVYSGNAARPCNPETG